MRICRFGDGRRGEIDGDTVIDITEALNCIPARRYPFPSHDLLVENLDAFRSAAASINRSTRYKLSEVDLLSPVANPGRFVAAPVNYKAHLDKVIADQATFAREHFGKIQETGLFLKATSSMVGASDGIKTAHPDRRTVHEIELAAIIGKPCRNASRKTALSYVAGFTICLDITIRGPEECSLRKSLDTYSVLSPWMVNPAIHVFRNLL